MVRILQRNSVRCSITGHMRKTCGSIARSAESTLRRCYENLVCREVKQELDKANLFIRQYMDYEKYVEDAELEVLRFWKQQATKEHYRLISTGSDEVNYLLDLIIEIEESIDTWVESINMGDKTIHRKVW